MKERIPDWEFFVWFDGQEWRAKGAVIIGHDKFGLIVYGMGTTPITALMEAEAAARKAERK